MDHQERFLKYLALEKNYSGHTVTSYKKDLEQFSTFLASHLFITDVMDIRHGHVRSWLVYLMRDDYTAKSINRKISSLKSYFKFLRKIDVVHTDPMAKVIAPKTPKRLPKIIREDDLQQVLSPIDEPEESFQSVRDQLIIDMLYSSGMRRAELIGLQMSDLDIGRAQLKVLGKGNKERLIPISTEMRQKIENYIHLRRELHVIIDNESLFLTEKGKKLYPKKVYNVVKNRLAHSSTATHRSPHVLRHSFATHMADHGASLNAIKEIMGHANLSSTEIYMHNSVDRLKKVYSQAHPKAEEK